MLVDTISRFKDLRVLLIGDAMLDTYLEGTAQRICSEGPVPVVQKSSEDRAPGGAANTAVNLRALGADVDFLTVIGSDMNGIALQACLVEGRVGDRSIVIDPEYSTIHKLRIVAEGQYVVRFDEGEPNRCSPDTQTALIRRLEEAFTDCDLVVVSDYGYGVLGDAVLRRLGELREDRPVPLFVDSKDIRRFRGLRPSLVTPNHAEAVVAVERRMPRNERINLDDVDALARRLVSLVETERVAITLGGDGVYLIDVDGTATHVASHPVVKAHDVGAGDSFLSAIALAMSTGLEFKESSRVAIEAARIAVAKRRTAVVQHQELIQSVSRLDMPDPAPIRELESALKRRRQAGDVIVFTNGVFDLLHAGHVEFLRAAKALGDVLVVAVNTDESARRLKGRNRPINSQRDRLALVAALDSVDWAILFDEDEPSQVIRRLSPHIHAKGGDYAGEELPEAEAVEEVGGRIEILPLRGSLSTTSVIDRIVQIELGARPRMSAKA